MGTDFNQKAENPPEPARSTFFEAARAGDTQSVTLLLQRHPWATHWRNSARKTPLMVAIEGKQEAMALLLIGQGSDIGHKDNDGWTPLIHAVVHDMPRLVRLLITKGANIEDRMISSEMTPLLAAGMMGRTECAEILMQAGADAKAVDDRRLDAAQWAGQSGHAATQEAIRSFPGRHAEKLRAEKEAAAKAIDAEAHGGTAAPLQVGKPLKLKT